MYKYLRMAGGKGDNGVSEGRFPVHIEVQTILKSLDGEIKVIILSVSVSEVNHRLG